MRTNRTSYVNKYIYEGNDKFVRSQYAEMVLADDLQESNGYEQRAKDECRNTEFRFAFAAVTFGHLVMGF